MSRTIIVHKADMQNDKEMRNTADGKLIFTEYQGKKCALLISDNRLIAASFYGKRGSKIGGIYIGKVKNVVKNLDAYFVEIAGGEICFLSGKEAKAPYILNRTFDGRILESDEVLVQVTKDAHKTKQASVSCNLKCDDMDVLIQIAAHRTCFTCLQSPKPEWQRILDSLVSEDEYAEIITDDKALYEEMLTHEDCISQNIRFYEDRQFALAKLYSVESKIGTAINPRIWLKSGAYLVIEQTEALTVIDVNSGKYDAKKASDEMFYQINREAASEIALQLRLRNLSGIIIVDFINMKSKELQKELLEELRELVKCDKQLTRVIDMTPLGLVEITRKKGNKTLAEQFKNA